MSLVNSHDLVLPIQWQMSSYASVLSPQLFLRAVRCFYSTITNAGNVNLLLFPLTKPRLKALGSEERHHEGPGSSNSHHWCVTGPTSAGLLRGCMVCVAGTESVGNKYIDDFVEVEETFLINMIQIK